MPAPYSDLDALRAEAAHLRRVNQELLATVAELRATIEEQQAHIDRLVRLAFGRKSERAAGPTATRRSPRPRPRPHAADAPPLPGPMPGPSKPRRRGHGRRPIAGRPAAGAGRDRPDRGGEGVPVLPGPRVRIGADVSERLDYRPASLFVRQTVRLTYACRSCERAGDDPRVARPPSPPEPIPRGSAAAGLLAHVIVSKYVDHLPLYRQESILGRLGWEVTRSTLCDQVTACAGVLDPLYRLMCDRVRASASLHTDDTPVPLLAPRRTAHAWVYVGDAANPYTVFDLSVGRSRDAPTAFLKGYTGFVHADGYAGYNPVYEAGARHVGCWAHARRYFFDARLSDPERSHDALARIRALYAVEREAKERKLTGADLAAYRQEHAGPVLAAFADWLADQRPRVLPKSAIGRGGHLRDEPVADPRRVPDRRPADDRQRAGRAGHPAAVRRPPELAAPGRGRRAASRGRAAEHRRIRRSDTGSTRGPT